MNQQEKFETVDQFKSAFLPNLQKREIASRSAKDMNYGSYIAYRVLDGIKADISKLKKKKKN